MTNATAPKLSWFQAIKDATSQWKIPLPSFTNAAMGSATCRDYRTGRFVTFRHRLIPNAETLNDGIQWTLWTEKDDHPELILSFRERIHPSHDDVAKVLSILKGWLIDNLTLEQTKQLVAGNGVSIDREC
jgi:hypothetical protein